MPLSSYLTRLILVCVLPLIIFSGWLSYKDVRERQDQQENEAVRLASNFATAIDHHLSARIGSLSVMATSPLADDPALWPIYYKVAQGFYANFRSNVVFAEAVEPMRMIFNTRAPFGAVLPNLPKPAGNSAAERVLATGRPAVGDIFVGPIAKEKLIAVGVPVLRDGKVTRILLATFDLRHFQERVEQVALPSGWILTLLDAQQEVIASGKSTSPVTSNGAEPYRRIVVKTTTSPWSVMLEIPSASYYAPMIDAGIGLGVGLLLAAMIGIGGGLWGTRRINRAVTSLSERSYTSTDGPEIAEFAAVRQRIDEASQRIASFAGAQDQAVEQERRRVAREVHDQMGQVFTAIRMIVQSIPSDAMPANQEQALNQALEMGIASARKISAELRPPLLDDLGLAAAVEYFCKELTRSTELTCVVDLCDQERLCGPQALTLFRIIQEAFNNILRHANARYVEINGHAADDYYVLLIEDDGKGFDVATVRQGAMGLVNMRERARLMNGQCEISVQPSGGTIVTISLPLDKAPSGSRDEIATG